MILAISLSLLSVFIPTLSQEPTQTTYLRADFADPDILIGSSALADGKYPIAIEFFKQFTEKNPNDFRGYYYLGKSYRGAQQFDEAITAFEKAAKIKSFPALAQFELCKMALELKNYEVAVKQYKRLQEVDGLQAFQAWKLIPEEVARKYQLSPPAVGATPAELQAAEPIFPLANDLKPTTTYRKRARYTETARQNKISGTVVLGVVFSKQGQLLVTHIVSGLPDGLTESAIEAARGIQFRPAIKDGQPISVSGTLDFKFDLY